MTSFLNLISSNLLSFCFQSLLVEVKTFNPNMEKLQQDGGEILDQCQGQIRKDLGDKLYGINSVIYFTINKIIYFRRDISL